MRRKLLWSLNLSIAIFWRIGPAWGQDVRGYEAQFTSTAPTIDGTIETSVWDAAGVEGDWQLLREDNLDIDNHRFRALWDDDALYMLLETDFSAWFPSTGDPAPEDFNNDNWNIYFDPNLDGDENFDANPTDNPDNYHIAFSSFEGTSLMQGDDFDGNWFFSQARARNNFGNNTGWRAGEAGLRGFEVAQTNGLDGGIAEIRIPWSEFDAPAELEIGGEVVDTGLNHPIAPSAGDTWFLQVGRISTDALNLLPIWNWHQGQFFAQHPHGEITFVGENSNGGEGIPGDYNNNGQVEQGDLDLVLLNWGSTPTDLMGIGWTNDLPEGAVDQGELDGVLLNWGNTAQVAAAAIPEPASWALLILAAVAASALRARLR